jgi:hypothetical protein
MKNSEDIQKKQEMVDFNATAKSVMVSADDENLIDMLNPGQEKNIQPKKILSPKRNSPKRESPKRETKNHSDLQETSNKKTSKLSLMFF